MQLDDKRWGLPDATGRGFYDSVGYLQDEADQIKLNTPAFAELHIFGIRCTDYASPLQVRSFTLWVKR